MLQDKLKHGLKTPESLSLLPEMFSNNKDTTKTMKASSHNTCSWLTAFPGGKVIREKQYLLPADDASCSESYSLKLVNSDQLVPNHSVLGMILDNDL